MKTRGGTGEEESPMGTLLKSWLRLRGSCRNRNRWIQVIFWKWTECGVTEGDSWVSGLSGWN